MERPNFKAIEAFLSESEKKAHSREEWSKCESYTEVFLYCIGVAIGECYGNDSKARVSTFKLQNV